MIRRFNRHQIILAILSAVGGVFCYFLSYLFFRYVPSFAAAQFGFRWSTAIEVLVAFVVLAAISVSGYRIWRAGGGLRAYHESGLYHDLGEDSGGAMVVDHYVRRITGPAHILSQLFLAGPLLLLRARTLVASMIPDQSNLEAGLEETLEILRTAGKWQSITEYPERIDEILYLARMGKIDFSTAKGIPRIKAHTHL